MDQRRLLYSCGDAWKEHLSFMFVSVLLCTDTQVMNVSPRGLSLGGIPGVTLIAPWVGIRGKQVFSMVRSWTLVRDAIRSTLVHPHPVSVAEPGGTSVTPASVRDRLSPTRKEKFWCKVCLHPHLEQGWMPQVEKKWR